jgi:hypothetical protein
LLLIAVWMLCLRSGRTRQSQASRDASIERDTALPQTRDTNQQQGEANRLVETADARDIHLPLRQRSNGNVDVSMAMKMEWGNSRTGGVLPDARSLPIPLPRIHSFTFTPTNIVARSVRISSFSEPNVNVVLRLRNVSSEEIDAMCTAHGCDFVIDEQVVSKSAARFQMQGTNVGLVFVFRSRTEAEDAVRALRRMEEN